MNEVRHLFTARDLATIARNIGIVQAPEPGGVLDAIARAHQHTQVHTAAGLLFAATLTAHPYGEDTIAFAVETARTFLLVNGVSIAMGVDRDRVLALVDSLRGGTLEDAAEIGKRLSSL